MGHWAVEDAFFKIEQVDALEHRLREAAVEFEFHRYQARHAFANETLINPPIPAKYNPQAADTAWKNVTKKRIFV
jgi:carboxymethylenebutenolidase